MLREVSVSCFEEWRPIARGLIQEGIDPASVIWNGENAGSLELGLVVERRAVSLSTVSVPKAFLLRAEWVACHAAADTWSLLYRLLWRLAVGKEAGLLSRANDVDVSEFLLREKAVRRERHKMTAFVRFRKVGNPETEDTDKEEGSVARESYVAWYEPVHDVVRLAAGFFRDRFATMNWSILTPRTCVHWDGRSLRFTEGVSREAFPGEDELEVYWKKYYASTFNPARLNMAMMEREMPRRYWKNLPEAELISELANGSYGRSKGMVEHTEDSPSRRLRKPKGAPDGAERATCRSPEEVRMRADGLQIDALRSLAERCQACHLCERATQTVFGEGPSGARVVFVGEQPGDREDLEGRPFVGPAGQLLDSVFSEVGLQRSRVYLTNAVKHFKWIGAKQRRLHQNPSAGEIEACRPWLLAELDRISPALVVCLGATAGRAVLGRPVSVMSDRGLIDDPGRPFQIVLTYHPSYLLRLGTRAEREAAEANFVEDLALVRQIESHG
ncbi:UdgX family uracil-DNA binding protein [Pelagicoccus sp. SDUM812005]|uniref:UdgX family uracil-DNA binding protein n=1 Tax=Pelagicoccus sp. SDUM812005 TaxID=3041257 RepID=UPI00280F5158|nr:UdgX family uracil-DNA binding protein [Pelagicoccus sp. SDUM812005]MDQ8182824.1 UdgX family uracil-DNA binding protein [Pelagicoccus sp. SDUM812005]